MKRVVLVGCAIRLQHLRSVVTRIKSDGEQVPICRGIFHGFEPVLYLFEVSRQARAKLRDGAAREEKRQGNGLALEIGKADRLSKFVREFVISQRVFGATDCRGVGSCL